MTVRTTRRAVVSAAALMVAALTATACGSPQETASGGGAGAPVTARAPQRSLGPGFLRDPIGIDAVRAMEPLSQVRQRHAHTGRRRDRRRQQSVSHQPARDVVLESGIQLAQKGLPLDGSDDPDQGSDVPPGQRKCLVRIGLRHQGSLPTKAVGAPPLGANGGSRGHLRAPHPTRPVLAGLQPDDVKGDDPLPLTPPSARPLLAAIGWGSLPGNRPIRGHVRRTHVGLTQQASSPFCYLCFGITAKRL